MQRCHLYIDLVRLSVDVCLLASGMFAGHRSLLRSVKTTNVIAQELLYALVVASQHLFWSFLPFSKQEEAI